MHKKRVTSINNNMKSGGLGGKPDNHFKQEDASFLARVAAHIVAGTLESEGPVSVLHAGTVLPYLLVRSL